MLVSWQWLNDYVDLSGITADDLASRFAMSGLNHEQTLAVGKDTVIDLEVTSNRGDCLGHIGVAREAAVLLDRSLRVPEPQPLGGLTSCRLSIRIENEFPEACTRYIARVIRGVQIGPSPSWLVQRLEAIGVKSVNNVVDITNYVMFECGQPLHAFDLKQIRGGKIVVRPASPGEQFIAIDHRTYSLDQTMVVIADAQRPVALGGIMGGAESEISSQTTDLLIEAALFQPLAIRRAARQLKLHSPSSFRFERRPDPMGTDWASRRCCELILQIAGGSLESDSVSTGQAPSTPAAIRLRLNQIPRLLGIEIDRSRVASILSALGCRIAQQSDSSDGELLVTAPSWRGDVSREVDLIEEIARIHGYDRIPEDAQVPMSVAQPRPKDLAVVKIRHVLSAYGIDEAMTPSVVQDRLESHGSPWTDQAPLATETPLLEGARMLRRSLLPSLLAARQANQAQSIRNAQLYEIANIVLPDPNPGHLPRELPALGLVTAGDLRQIKGIVEAILDNLGGGQRTIWATADHPMFAPGTLQRLELDGQLLGWLGLVSAAMLKAHDLDGACAAAELDVGGLVNCLVEVRRAVPYSLFPAIERDLNFIVDEALRWDDLQRTCRSQGGNHLQRVTYRETYRDSKKDGADKKRVLLSLSFQDMQRTLTGEEVDSAVASVVAACGQQYGAKLLG
ncbi:MAG: phenylalanine--tRNA ligase subunit beta [Pirellulaceae bacterium]|nr:phenylalanine--tRNA ligase subunit beta [Pirellulaceae bacterium]